MEKKGYFLFLFILFTLQAKSQLPEIVSNVQDTTKHQDVIYQNFHDKYEFVLAYTEESYWWANKKRYWLLAYNNGIWQKGTYFSDLKKDEWSKPKIKIKNVSKVKATQIIKYLTVNGFWLLSRDSLNITKRRNADSSITKFSISDGVNYKFVILKGDDLKIIESYEPQYFLSKLPEFIMRETFIKCWQEYLEKFKQM